MPTGQPESALHHVRRAALLSGGTGLTDGQLLGRFLEQHSEAAFEALLRRHGPMVRALDDPSWVVRERAASCLGHIGPGARDALALLRRVAKEDPLGAVRASADLAIRQIGGKPRE